jgi:hypothetical protein
MKNFIYRCSILGVPIGALGFLLKPGWIQYLIFFIGAVLCGLGWMFGLEKEAEQTLEEQSKKNVSKTGELRTRPSFRNISMRDWAHHLSILGLLIGLFGFAFGAGWVRYLFFFVGGVSCVLVWYFEKDRKK